MAAVLRERRACCSVSPSRHARRRAAREGYRFAWDTLPVPDLDAMCDEADGALLRCLELAHESFLAGGLPVGSVITDGHGERVSEGRNRAYDPAGGTDRLQRTPIAHAEMNALAAVSTETDLGGLALWSSHRPCLMCAAACEFTGVAAYSGPSAPMILRARQREPEITSLMQATGDTVLRQAALRDCLVAAWPAVQAAAAERCLRLAKAPLPVLSAYRSAGTAELPVWRRTIRMTSSGS